MVNRNAWPVVRQYFASVRIDLAERHGLKAHGLEPQGETTDAGEGVE
jgi:hypothetical protein